MVHGPCEHHDFKQQVCPKSKRPKAAKDQRITSMIASRLSAPWYVVFVQLSLACSVSKVKLKGFPKEVFSQGSKIGFATC